MVDAVPIFAGPSAAVVGVSPYGLSPSAAVVGVSPYGVFRPAPYYTGGGLLVPIARTSRDRTSSVAENALPC